jgi:hypothetical protein
MNSISDIRVNCMGTNSIKAKFQGMRKEQEFILYPLQKDSSTDRIKIQSDTRIGYISLSTGAVQLCPPVSSGAYAPHLIFVRDCGKLTDDELVNLKLSIFQTRGDKVGNNAMSIYCDNSQAENVLTF